MGESGFGSLCSALVDVVNLVEQVDVSSKGDFGLVRDESSEDRLSSVWAQIGVSTFGPNIYRTNPDRS